MSNGNVLTSSGPPAATFVGGMINFNIQMKMPLSATEGGINENNFLRFSSGTSPLCNIKYVIDPSSIGGAEMIVLGSSGVSVTEFCQQDLVNGTVIYKPGTSGSNSFIFSVFDQNNKIASGMCSITRYA